MGLAKVTFIRSVKVRRYGLCSCVAAYNMCGCLYYIKNQLDAALAILFISHCKITLRVSDAFSFHYQEY